MIQHHNDFFQDIFELEMPESASRHMEDFEFVKGELLADPKWFFGAVGQSMMDTLEEEGLGYALGGGFLNLINPTFLMNKAAEGKLSASSGKADRARPKKITEEERIALEESSSLPPKMDEQLREDYLSLLGFVGECNTSYEGFVAVAYVALNRAAWDNMTIREVGEKEKQFMGYHYNENIDDVPDYIKRAAIDVLTGEAENPIGDSRFFFGVQPSMMYDLWVDMETADFVKEIDGNVFFTADGSVHNMSTMSEEKRMSKDVIIIYDARKNSWVRHGEIVVDGEVVRNEDTE